MCVDAREPSAAPCHPFAGAAETAHIRLSRVSGRSRKFSRASDRAVVEQDYVPIPYRYSVLSCSHACAN